MKENKINLRNISMQITKLTIFFILINFTSPTFAQEAVITSGNEANSSTGKISYSIGQVFYSTYTDYGGSILEGLQQPYEISVLSINNDFKNNCISIAINPNPTTDYLTIELTGCDNFLTFYIQLLDFQGKVLQTHRITNSKTIIFMGDYIPGIYLIKISEKKDEIKTFKIIKY